MLCQQRSRDPNSRQDRSWRRASSDTDPFLTTSDTMSTGAPPTSTGSVKLDAIKQTAEAKLEPKKLTGLNLYGRFAFAGAVCCSVTHGALTPIDV